MYFAVVKKRKVLYVFSLIMTLFVLSSIFSSGFLATFSTKRTLPIYRVKREDKVLSISFDCAWGVDYTQNLLDVMEKEQVKCTFFAVEFWVKKHPDFVKKIVESGHEIGTHSATHPYMSKLSKDAILKELSTSIKAIEDIVDKKVTLFRPPYGDYNDLLVETAKDMGLYAIQWDVDSLDWKNLSAENIKNRVLERVKNGSIVLFHNQGLHTAEAVAQIIPKLKSEGYKFLPIGELIYKKDYSIAPNGEQYKNQFA